MDQTTRTEQANGEQRTERVRQTVHRVVIAESERRYKQILCLAVNTKIRELERKQGGYGLPPQTRWLGDLATAGVIS